MLQTLFQMLFLATMHANASFETLLKALCLFSDASLCSYNINFNKSLWNYEFIFAKINLH